MSASSFFLCLSLCLAAACGDVGDELDGGADSSAQADLEPASLDLERSSIDMPRTDGGGFGACNSLCDCPAGTLCTIDHVCMSLGGEPYTALCDATGSCPCGYTCVDGYCPPLYGSLTSCNAGCDCGPPEKCVNHRCVTTQNGGDASCNGAVDCQACAGTICLPLDGNPGDSGYCGKPSQCFVDMNCVSNVAFGQRCVCPDGGESNCAATGHCDAFPGTALVNGPALSAPSSPSGGCQPTERVTATVTASASFSKLTFYGEIDPSIGVAMMQLIPPGGGAPTYITVSGGTVYVSVQSITPLPSTLDGTWTLCAYAGAGGAYQVLKWTIYGE